ncbi:hypothetical protein PP178_04165 [Zeaxanthinibacter sp. PT1]|uniref:hypothetical protein n=1 Tax=Zeaxanthinibacter TaxID=561554 RepID=UPI00234A422F|nr:hypothetical protein [Zeaxanthinibacter sp. PT1]MDC6350736.1 hypothetical protein [Zeaxanthinibacter sp. PT1]
MENSLEHLDANHQADVFNGKFMLFTDEDPRYRKIMGLIKDSVPFAQQLRRQVRQAFNFNEPQMIDQIEKFIVENTPQEAND